VLLFILIFFVTAPILAKIVAEIIKRWNEKSEIPGLLPTTIVGLILFFAWLAHALDAPELLGGFAAGLALSRKFYFPLGSFFKESKHFSTHVEEQMKPIVHLFTPIFFVAIGLSLDLGKVNFDSSFVWNLSGLLLAGAIIGKLLSGFVLLKEKRIMQWIIGAAMIPRGEVGLIFANIGLTSKVFNDDVYAAVLLVLTLTTLLAPFSLRALYSYQKAK
jgi:Kef-type K+ transport system membrane component KefB